MRIDLTAAVLMEADLKSVNMSGALADQMVERRSFWCSSIYADGILVTMIVSNFLKFLKLQNRN